MRTGWISAGIVVALALGTIAATRPQPLGPNPVVVELFTSQG
jgi:hypothetical protein